MVDIPLGDVFCRYRSNGVMCPHAYQFTSRDLAVHYIQCHNFKMTPGWYARNRVTFNFLEVESDDYVEPPVWCDIEDAIRKLPSPDVPASWDADWSRVLRSYPQTDGAGVDV
jgi:hypothetical protein